MYVLLNSAIKILSFTYWFFKLLPSSKKVTFISRQSNEPSLDISMLSGKITELHPEYECVILCRKIEGGIMSKLRYCFHMLRQMYHLATSEVIVLDSYSILVSILDHKKNLLVIQMWHSVGTMKKFGYSILDMPEGSSSKLAHIMKMHRGYDYILAASEAYKPHLADGFNYPIEKIITMPLPRVEALKDKSRASQTRQKILEKYPQLGVKKNILYVPTFRKEEPEKFKSAAASLADAVDYENYNLIIKVHPLAELDLTHEHAIIDNYFSSFDMLFIADYVISDYSCIIYEAAIRKLPLYLYTYDYEHYMNTRDIYMDYKKEMPGPVCNTAADTVQAIKKDICRPKDVEKFLNKYVYSGSKHETQDIVDFIFSNKKCNDKHQNRCINSFYL